MLPKDAATILDMLQASQRAVEGLDDSTLQQLTADWKIQSIVLHQLLILGEATKRLSPEFRATYPDIPWQRIAGMRDILIHGYDIVDLETVWLVITKELPDLISFLESLRS